MGQNAPNWYVPAFDDKATEVFQAKGNLLRGTFSTPIKKEASQVTFFVAGRGEAEPLQRGSMGGVMNAGRGILTATMQDWQAAEWAYETDLEKMSVDERAVIASQIGKACGRRADLIPINEINSATLTMVDATNAGGNANSASPFTLVMALTGIRILQTNDVEFDDGNVFCGMPATAWNQFTSYKQVNSSDWVGVDGLPYKTGRKFKDWNGVRWFRMPDSYCPVTGTSAVDFFMWHKSAVGQAVNYELRTDVTWENLYSGWYHNSRFAATAKVLLPPGIIRFRYGGNASAITLN